ncbi:MAG TPA: helix-turn-helix domain-containing protein, partial [bacterium]
DFDTPSGKYDKSGLSQDKAEMIHKALLSLMDKKQPYTDPDLTLGGLAGYLGVSPHNLSEVINTGIGSNFFDFISRYRVDRVRRDLSNPDKKNLKLLAIAFEAGFNSKSSFNSVFKKFTNTTPSRFRRNTESVMKP